MTQARVDRGGHPRPAPTPELRRDPVLFALGVTIVACCLGYGLGLGTLRAQVIVCWTTLLGLHTGLALISWQLAHTPQGTRAGRRLGWALCFAGVAFAIGDIGQLVLIATRPLSLPVIVGGHLQTLALLTGLAGPIVIMMPELIKIGSPRDRRRFYLDAAVVIAAAATIGAYAVTPVIDSSRSMVVLQVLTGPGIFLFAAFMVLRLVVGLQRSMTRPAGLLLAVVVAAEAANQAALGALLEKGRVHWEFGITVVINALLTASVRVQQVLVRTGHDEDGPQREPDPPLRPLRALPLVAIAATNLLLVAVMTSYDLPWRTWVTISGSLVCTTLIVVRQMTAHAERGQLLRALDEKVEQLRDALDERDRLAGQLHRLAFYDPLTGLANRLTFRDRLDEALAVPATGHELPALMIIDLDDFKPINDQYGHATGDKLLTVVAQRLSACVREADLVARLGGDEFGVLTYGLPEQVAKIAERIVGALARPIVIGPTIATVSASVGVTLLRGDRTVEQVLHDADTAMYLAKKAGKSRYQLAQAAIASGA